MDVPGHKGWVTENWLRFQNSNCSHSVDKINNCTEKNTLSSLYLAITF